MRNETLKQFTEIKEEKVVFVGQKKSVLLKLRLNKPQINVDCYLGFELLAEKAKAGVDEIMLQFILSLRAKEKRPKETKKNNTKKFFRRNVFSGLSVINLLLRRFTFL